MLLLTDAKLQVNLICKVWTMVVSKPVTAALGIETLSDTAAPAAWDRNTLPSNHTLPPAPVARTLPSISRFHARPVAPANVGVKLPLVQSTTASLMRSHFILCPNTASVS